MAVYFQNTLVSTSDYLKETHLYSSPQSVWRARKKGTLKTTGTMVGDVFFLEVPPPVSAQLLLLTGWEGLPTVTPAQIPAGLTLVSRISKSIGRAKPPYLPGQLLISWMYTGWAVFYLPIRPLPNSWQPLHGSNRRW